MRRLLAFLFGGRRVVEIDRARPGPSRRQRERAKIIATMRDLRFELRMPFR